ncbi:agamous-like MADS-box protein AGL29 [Solanum pennellii]|uniref:Agamous-like MADS-box protein AGL29 n=1 Tax=Solanum pennellii TaxID=28526 RepID=A0ABM1GDG7_SOLPN|nr:agamous-like MADS-box protein AGL29 [Solanum pennellii]
MENETKKGKQKIEMKLIKSERACAVSFSKRKKTLFDDAKKFATQNGADVGVMLFSPGGKPYCYGSTSVEDIIENFLKMKVEEKSNGFEKLKDLHKELETCNEKEKKRVLMHRILNPGLEIPQDKHMEEQKLALKLRVEKIKKETQNSILMEHLKFDLNVAPEPQDEE